VVYEALHESHQRRVALKILRKMDLGHPAALERFWREAQTMARLQHPHIVQLLEVGEAEGQLFLTLEFVEGRSLEEELRTGPLACLSAACLVETLARTIHHAHRQGVVHRDLKPANVLLERCAGGDYVPKIADFGLAHPAGGRDLTMTGDLVGTPGYMAPEQTWGKCRPRRIGPAADIYSLGAILYAALTGRAPFVACTALDTLEMVRFQDPVRPARLRSEVPRDLETICLKCLEKDPLRRYATAAALADDLRRFQAGEPIAARRACSAVRLTRWCRRNALTLFGVAALVAATYLSTAQSYQVQLRQQQTLAQTGRQEASMQRKERTSHTALARSVRLHGEPPRVRECPLGAWNYSLLRMAMRMFVI
jgi:serine/threonine-protein kinase